MIDDKLIIQIQQGNEAAAEELIKRWYPAILRYCRWHCVNSTRAEDLTQEVFYKLFRSISQYDDKRKFKAYIYAIARNQCIDESRRQHVYPLDEEGGLIDPAEPILQIENRLEVATLLCKLPSEQKEAVILKFGEQLSYREIAAVTGCNMRTAQSRVRNALNTMRKESRHEE